MKILVKNRSGHDMSHMGPYLKSFLPYAQKRMGFNRPPTIFFDSDPQNAENVLGKTAYYNPETEEIVVFVDKRHPKDILRSLSHELVHHSQNCRGDLNPEIAGETTPGYAQTNAHMRAMEGEAYLKGNGYYFRDWEDSLKNGLEETNYKHITGDTHKMATYDQLKEEITAKVVAALSEKIKNPGKYMGGPRQKAGVDDDGDGVPDGDDSHPKDGAKNESVNEEEIEERKKRDTPRDSDRREAEKLKINEEEEELDEISSDYGPNGYDPGRDGGHSGRSMTNKERDEAAKRAKEKLKKQGINEAQEEVVEETISNDQWYQSELFESLKKRWTK